LLFYMVPRDGIEPPTRGFSVQAKPSLYRATIKKPST